MRLWVVARDLRLVVGPYSSLAQLGGSLGHDLAR